MAGIGHRGFFRRKGNEPQEPFFTFKTKFNGEVSFRITKSGIPATWYMGDGTIYTNTNSVTHTYVDGSEKEVFVSVDDFDNVTGLGSFISKEITEFYAQELNYINGNIDFLNNPIIHFELPTSQVGVTGLVRLTNANLGNLNVSGVNFGLSGNNRRLTATNSQISIITGLSGKILNYLELNDNLLASIDLTNVSRNQSGATIPWNFSNNPNLLTVSMPDTQQPNQLGVFDARNCPQITHLDLSMFYPGGIYDIFLQGCTNLSSVVWPAINSVDVRQRRLNLSDTNIEFIDLRWSTLGFGTGPQTAYIWLLNTPNAKWLKVADGSVFTFSQSNNANMSLRVINSSIESIDFSNALRVSGNLFVIDCPNLTEFLLPSNSSSYNANNIQIINCPLLSAPFNLYTQCLNGIDQFTIQNCPLLPSLNEVGVNTISSGGNCWIINVGITSLDFSNWVWTQSFGQLRITNNNNLTTLIIGEFTGNMSNGLLINNNPSLSDIIFQGGSSWESNGGTFSFTGNALSSLSIDKFLVDLDNYAASGGRVLDFRGGTNAAPTDGSITGFDGIAAVASLTSKGFTVFTN